MISGNSGDSVNVIDGTWTNAGTITFNGTLAGLSGTYNVWNLGFEQLIVQSLINTTGLP